MIGIILMNKYLWKIYKNNFDTPAKIFIHNLMDKLVFFILQGFEVMQNGIRMDCMLRQKVCVLNIVTNLKVLLPGVEIWQSIQ